MWHHRRIIKLLAGILRIAVALNKTKNQRVKQIACQVTQELEITVSGAEDLEVIWAARRISEVLADALKRKVKIQNNLCPLK